MPSQFDTTQRTRSANPNHDDLFTAIAELEQTVSDGAGRTTERMATRSRVLIRPGNSSERFLREPLHAVSLDISSTGCRLVSSSPLGVGDVYWLEFEREQLNLPAVFARCLRCRLTREDAFEAGFAFFQSLELPTNEADAGLTLL